MRNYLDSISMVTDVHRGSVVISASHGGVYPSMLAAKAGLRAVVFNDAGIGRDQAGIGGIVALADIGMAAAAVDCMSCRIGDGADMAERGVISFANDPALAVGVKPGQHVTEAARLMATAPMPIGDFAEVAEGRYNLRVEGLHASLVIADSGSLFNSGDDGSILVMGSHGGVLGKPPGLALPATGRFVAFNDAGGGADDWGISRLSGLDDQQIPAAGVSHWAAKIGNGRSVWEEGIVSCVNKTAESLGVKIGLPLQQIIGMKADRSGKWP
ncbi:hypothetical protein KO498_13455 [Lentibacter algarum]|uniref:hypothetical protein n=1 Tax=Lentibacter algarum TaxID=576131 RepID=UPI001C094F7A|nr:hypothetical protein [Lentibacter algarum]MBU2982818.1 hypothetical protein [Lentibacter algarum]